VLPVGLELRGPGLNPGFENWHELFLIGSRFKVQGSKFKVDDTATS
jgi:hypothetical protein